MPNTSVPAAGEAMPVIGRFSRRALLGAIAAVPATAALATPPKVFPDFGSTPVAPAAHPDAVLFALDREMAEARAKMDQAYKVASESGIKRKELYPPEPPKWEEPSMPADLGEIFGRTTMDEFKRPETTPAPLRAWWDSVRERREEHKALEEAYRAECRDINSLEDPAEDACDAAVDGMWDIADRIFATQANTLDGILVKLRAVDKLELRSLAADDTACESVEADIRRLAARSA